MSVVCVVSCLILIGFHLRVSYQIQEDHSFQKIESELEVVRADIAANVAALRQDVTFLAAVPPIEGILNASTNNGIDSKDGSTISQWQDRLAQIFQEMLLAKPSYIQLRYIGVADEGRELVRVDRRGPRVVRVANEMLQQKAAEPYFQAALGVSQGRIYLSEFSLNREFGKIEQPPRLVIRAVVPIHHAQGEVFGMVVINMTAEELLLDHGRKRTGERVTAILDQELQPLISTSTADSWALGLSNLDLSPQVLSRFKAAHINQPHFRDVDGAQLVVGRKVFYDHDKPERFLALAMATSQAPIKSEVYSNIITEALLALVIVIFSVSILVLIIKSQLRRLVKLKVLAEDLAAGKLVDIPKRLADSHDEIGALFHAFYKMSREIQSQTSMLSAQKQALDATALVSETDAKGRITYANKKFIEVAGFPLADLLGSDHRIINSGYHDKEFFADLWRTISQGSPWRGEVRNKRKDGSFYWVDSSVVPFRDPDGKITKYVSVRLDITQKKEQERKLHELTAAKAKFLAMMSHEIRTPLGGVVGAIELLADTKLDASQKELVGSIGECADVLLRIVNDILDFSKLDAGKLEIFTEDVAIREILATLNAIFVEKADSEDLILKVTVAENVPQYLKLDVTRFKQVLINLVSNALKFTQRGRVEVSASYTEDAGSGLLVLEVRDTGIGLTSGQCARIFDEYVQADMSTTKSFGGTGLGLAICKKIITAMSGSIEVASQVGIGSVFTVRIPTGRGTGTAVGTAPNRLMGNAFAGTDLKVLLADDYHLNQTIFTKMLSDMGIAVVSVDNGEKAVEEFTNGEFNLVFLDIQMPILDGVEACQLMRRHPKSANSWIVAITANSFREDIVRYFESGFDDYVAKPFTRASLQQALIRCSKKDRSQRQKYLADEPKLSDEELQRRDQFLDQEIVADHIERGAEFLQMLLQSFRPGISEINVNLHKAISARDLAVLRETCHAARGLSANMGFRACALTYMAVASAARAQDWQAAAEQFARIPEMIAASQGLLTQAVEGSMGSPLEGAG